MQKIKQSLAVLLALLMLVCAVPFAAFGADASTHTSSHKTYKTTTKEATCTEDGTEVETCEDCDYKVTFTLKATGHTWTETAAEQYLKTAADCQHKAVYYKSCSSCKISAKDETTVTDKTFEAGAVDPDKHPADQLENLDPAATGITPTCTSAGASPEQRCRLCQKVVPAKTLPALGHTTENPEKAATCQSLAVCARCHNEFGTFDKNNHPADKIVIVEARAATCTQTSLTEGKRCSACDTVILAQVEGEKKPHEYETVNKPATCEADGVQGRVECKVCHEVKKDETGKEITGTVIPKKGHDWGDWKAPEGYDCKDGGQISRTCKTCGKTEAKTTQPNAHEVVKDPAKEPTCTETGLSEGGHCAFCGIKMPAQQTIDALGHDFTGTVKANGTEAGTHSYQCVRCKEIGNDTVCTDENHDCLCDICKQQLKHKFDVYTPDGNATCKEDGTKTATCSSCGKVTDTQPDVDSHLKADHKFKYEYQEDATCLKNGHEIGTCELCGEKTEPREKENTALGHKEGDWRYNENYDCTVGGYREKVCERCGEQLNREEIESKPHDVVDLPAVAVTCEEDGKTEGRGCKVCGKVYIPQDIIPKLGHKPDSKGFSVVKKATCTEEGLEKAFCLNCEKDFTQPIPKTGHDYEEKVIAPSCSKDGYTLYTCKNCQATYTDKTVKKIGHHTWKLTVTPATTKKDGKRVYVCTVCKTRVVKIISKIASVKLAETKIAKDGKKHNPAVVVKDADGKTLKKGKAYTVQYTGGRKIIGSYTVTVTFIGNYSGTKALKFHIVPAAPKTVKATAAKGSVKLEWSKVSGGDRYIVYYSTSKDSGYKKVGVTAKTTSTVKNLKSGKTYYFKVKGVRVLENGNFNGVASAAAKAKVK